MMKTMMSRSSTAALVAAVSGSLVVVACNGRIGDSSHLDDNPDWSDGPGGHGGAGGASHPGFAGFDPGQGGQGGFDECAGVVEEATFIPVSMFITVDKSGSMADANKWSNVKAAFASFFTDQGAKDLKVALRFWPDAGCGYPNCDVNSCAVPQVTLGKLSDPSQVQELINNFNAKIPDGPTPMSAALGGACYWAAKRQDKKKDTEKVIVVLVTDGQPTSCDTNINNIAAHAANAFDYAKVRTFAVGLQGSNEVQLNFIAAAGHTAPAFFIGNGNAQAELLAALEAIQKTVMACSFVMPESDDPQSPVDPEQINVSYTPGGGGEPIVFGQVANKAACTKPDGGWYYDDPESPSTISLCKSTCNEVQSDPEGKIEIVLGCATQVQ